MNWGLLANSLGVAASVTIGAILMGVCVALWAQTLSSVLRRLIYVVAIAVLALPPFLVTNAWMDLLGVQGVLHGWFPWNLFSLPGVIGLLTLTLWPIPFLAADAAFQQISVEHLEVDAALSGPTLIRRILLPMAGPSLGMAGVLTLLLALNQFSIPTLLQVKVLSAELWIRYSTELNALSAFAVGWPLFLIPWMVAIFWKRSPWAWSVGPTPMTARRMRRQMGSGVCWLLGGIGLMVMILSLVAPLGQLVLSRRTWLEAIPALEASKVALGYSALDAAVVASCVVAFGVLLPLRRFERAVGAVSLGLLWVPGVLLGVLVLQCTGGHTDMGRGLLWAVLAMRYSAVGWHGIRVTREGLDPDLVDATRLGRLRGWDRFRHLLWAQRSSSVMAVWYAVYLLVLWDVEVMVLLQPPGGETLALRIFNLLHYGHNDQVNALCLHLLILALLPCVGWAVCTKAGEMLSLGRTRVGTRGWSGSISIGAMALALGVVVGVSGCSRAPEEKNATLASRVFARVELVGGRGTSAGLFNKPRSLAVDRNDFLYVVDMTGRVQKFSPDGKFLLMWQLPQTDLGKPKGMSCDPDGNIVVVEPHYQRVNHFTPDGALVRRWGNSGTNAGQLTLPRSVAVNSHGRIFLTEYTTVDRVQGFDWPSTEPRILFGKPGLGPGEFNRAEGITVDSLDRLWVADSCNHRIQLFSPEGVFVREHGHAGSGPGELSYPYDIRIDRQGRQIVCEFGNSRVQIFDDHDQLVEVLGGYGAKLGEFNNPWAIALDSKGNLYVADSGNHRVQKFIRRDS